MPDEVAILKEPHGYPTMPLSCKIKLLCVLEVNQKELRSVLGLFKVRRHLNFTHLSVRQAVKG